MLFPRSNGGSVKFSKWLQEQLFELGPQQSLNF